MSYQPQPPMAPTYAPAPEPAAAPERRRKPLLFAGIAVALVGVIAAGVIVGMAGSAKNDTVAGFARAPVGCTTTLEFEQRATFTLFVETKGTAIDVGGDCEGNGAAYDRGDDDLPRVTLTMTDDNDDEVAMTKSDAYSYSTTDFKGQAIEQVKIDRPGTYRLTVASDDTDFAIAVGGDPETDSGTLQALGGGVGLAGLVIGGALIMLGLRKRRAPSTPPANGLAWAPQSPATMPGYVPPGAAPAYQPPPTVAPSSPPPPSTPPPSTPPPPPPVAPGGGWGAPQP